MRGLQALAVVGAAGHQVPVAGAVPLSILGVVRIVEVFPLEGEMTELDKAWLERKLKMYDLEAPNGVENMTKIVAGLGHPPRVLFQWGSFRLYGAIEALAEDATEVYNLLDRNLAVGARTGKRMRDQALPFDPNDPQNQPGSNPLLVDSERAELEAATRWAQLGRRRAGAREVQEL